MHSVRPAAHHTNSVGMRVLRVSDRDASTRRRDHRSIHGRSCRLTFLTHGQQYLSTNPFPSRRIDRSIVPRSASMLAIVSAGAERARQLRHLRGATSPSRDGRRRSTDPHNALAGAAPASFGSRFRPDRYGIDHLHWSHLRLPGVHAIVSVDKVNCNPGLACAADGRHPLTLGRGVIYDWMQGSTAKTRRSRSRGFIFAMAWSPTRYELPHGHERNDARADASFRDSHDQYPPIDAGLDPSFRHAGVLGSGVRAQTPVPQRLEPSGPNFRGDAEPHSSHQPLRATWSEIQPCSRRYDEVPAHTPRLRRASFRIRRIMLFRTVYQNAPRSVVRTP